jgi:hypothetical protein
VSELFSGRPQGGALKGMMRWTLILCAIVIAGALLVVISRAIDKAAGVAHPGLLPSNAPLANAQMTILYQGHAVRLRKMYDSFDDFKDDDDNIAPDEVANVQSLVRSASMSKQLRDFQQVVEAVSAVKFPGYGETSCAEQVQPDGSGLYLASVEVPKANEQRYFLFRHRLDGPYVLVDDFLNSGVRFERAQDLGSKFRYLTYQNKSQIERIPFSSVSSVLTSTTKP